MDNKTDKTVETEVKETQEVTNEKKLTQRDFLNGFVDWVDNNKLKLVCIIGIVVGIVFIITGYNMEVTSSYILFPHEYVGGDAYNYIIEASIRGGKIGAQMITKALYICTGTLVTLISFINYFKKQ